MNDHIEALKLMANAAVRVLLYCGSALLMLWLISQLPSAIILGLGVTALAALILAAVYFWFLEEVRLRKAEEDINDWQRRNN